MTPADTLLSRLDGVRQVGADQYVARCPSHADVNPSLSIRDLGDRLLVHCHAACDPSEVMQAVGLSLADLFERPNEHQQKPVPSYSRWDYRALLRTLRAECGVVLIAANDLQRGNALSEVDQIRLREAITRISSIAEVANG